MNIFTPKDRRENELLPVYFYIHGGNFQQGNPGSPIFDAGKFASLGKAVIVFVGYRLGALGFLYDDRIGINGNYGFLDQREGMRFVKRNIQKFGGNPDLITLGGQSAGGSSTSAHLVSPKSWQYFSKAIIESNPYTIPWKRKHSAHATTAIFMKELNCQTAECLRTKTPNEIVIAQERAGSNVNITEFLHTFQPWTPVIDGEEITKQFTEAITDGTYHKIPLLFGTTSAEGMIFIQRGFKEPVSDLNYIGLLSLIFKKRTVEILSLYPAEPPGQDKRPVLTELANDYVFLAIQRHVLSLLLKNNPFKTYYWHFNRSFSFDGWGPDYKYCIPHACHGINVVYGFQSAEQFNRDEIILSNEMIKYYSNFIRTGDPNSGTLSPKLFWPSFNWQNKEHLQLETPSKIGTKLLEVKSNFWDRLGYNHGNGAPQ